MKLIRLWEQHQKFQNQGLSGSLGDGFLMAHNRVYQNVRRSALDAGFQFSSERNDAYEAFPLLQLENLLKSKTLPYSQNAMAFETMNSRELEVLTWEDLDGNLKKNYVFHEATHAVVRSWSQKFFASLVMNGSVEAQRSWALRMILEESCANACELFGMLDAGDAAHRAFYELNSYVCEFESRTHLKNAVAEFGSGPMLHLFVLAYMQANFLREAIDESEFKAMLEMSSIHGVDAKKSKALRSLCKIVFNLNERFRYQTTGFHLRLAGINLPIEDLFDFDFLSELQKTKGIESFFKGLGQLAP